MHGREGAFSEVRKERQNTTTSTEEALREEQCITPDMGRKLEMVTQFNMTNDQFLQPFFPSDNTTV